MRYPVPDCWPKGTVLGILTGYGFNGCRHILPIFPKTIQERAPSTDEPWKETSYHRFRWKSMAIRVLFPLFKPPKDATLE